MSLQLPLISVVTPTFNRKEELVYLFNSMKKQTLDPKFFEMIISDDGSTDGTEAVSYTHLTLPTTPYV